MVLKTKQITIIELQGEKSGKCFVNFKDLKILMLDDLMPHRQSLRLVWIELNRLKRNRDWTVWWMTSFGSLYQQAPTACSQWRPIPMKTRMAPRTTWRCPSTEVHGTTSYVYPVSPPQTPAWLPIHSKEPRFCPRLSQRTDWLTTTASQWRPTTLCLLRIPL